MPPRRSAPSPYDAFAWFYQEYWGREVPLQLFAAVEELLLPHVARGARLLDLCCGTGQVAGALAARGFEVTGLDASREMLRHARQNAPGVRFVRADARSFRVASPYDAVVSTFDSLNHILTLGELLRVFGNVRRALRPAGLFFFDVNLERGFRRHWQEQFSVVEPERVCIVSGAYDAAARLGRYDFTLFRPAGGAWRRADFSIAERCYTTRELKGALRRARFDSVKVYDAARDAGLADHAGRAFFLARASAV